MRRPGLVLVLPAVVGAAVGFGAGALAYTVLAAALERTDGLRDLQGMAWNLVPLGTVAGGVLGGWSAGRWQRREGSEL